MNNKRVTIKDIASQLNISTGTVDRAINGKGRINAKTKKLVMQKVEELGYKPNRIARSLGKNQKTKLVFVSPAHNPFWQEIRNGAQTACDELRDYNVQLEFYSQKSDFDTICQIKDMEKIIQEKPRGIIVAPLDSCLLVKPINNAVETGIPVVTVNLDSRESKRICYIGEDPCHTGAIVGALFKKFIGRGGQVAVLTGDDDSSQFQIRKRGFLETILSNNSTIKISGYHEYANNEGSAYFISKKLISDIPDLKGIFANTAVGVVGIAKAIRDMDKKGLIITVCYDTSDEINELLDCDAMVATVTQNPFLQGYYSVRLLFKILLEKTPPEKVNNYIRTEIIVESKQVELNAHSENYNMFL